MLAAAARRLFTSEPSSSMPASIVFSTWYSCRAFLLRSRTFSPSEEGAAMAGALWQGARESQDVHSGGAGAAEGARAGARRGAGGEHVIDEDEVRAADEPPGARGDGEGPLYVGATERGLEVRLRRRVPDAIEELTHQRQRAPR